MLIQKGDKTEQAYIKSGMPPIPTAKHGLFQTGRLFGYEKPATIHGWVWSIYFARWSAFVTFDDAWSGYTYPKID